MTNKSNLRFKALPANAPSLFPEDILGKIPVDHPVRLVNQVVDDLGIDHIISEYKGGGTTSYHPRMLIKVLFYAYLSNVYSCRKIEKALRENIYFMWLAGNSMPDFRTINYFRGKRLKNHIHQLFADVVRLLQQLGYVSLEVQYIDGTKIESAANRYTFVWKKTVEKQKARLEQKIQSVIDEIDGHIKTDQQESNKTETPRPIDSTEIKTKLEELNRKNKQTDKATQKQLKQLQEKHLPRLKKYEQQLETLDGRNSFSKTDEDATFMRLKDDHMQNGQLKPAYNTQISTEEQFITHFSIHQTAGDTSTLKEHLDSFETQYQVQSKAAVTDAGYGSEENYELMEEKGIDAYVKYNYFHQEQKVSQKSNPFLVQNLYYNVKEDFYVCPMGQRLENKGKRKRISVNGHTSEASCYEARRCDGCPLRGSCHKNKGNRIIEVNHRLDELRAKAKNLLTSEAGIAHRKKRPVEVEAVFGQLKSNNQFTRFTLKTLVKVTIEFGLMSIGHNLRKLVAKSFKKGQNGQFCTYSRPLWLETQLAQLTNWQGRLAA